MINGDLNEAVLLYQKSLSILTEKYNPNHPIVAKVSLHLATAYQKTGDLAKAEQLVKSALSNLENKYSPEHIEIGKALSDLANNYLEVGDYNLAELYFHAALNNFLHNLDSNHDYIGNILSSLGILYRQVGDYEQAEEFLTAAVSIYYKKFGKDHVATAIVLDSLASLYGAMGKFEEAESLFQHALAIKVETVGPESLVFSNTLSNYADLYRDMGEYSKAETLYLASISIDEEKLGWYHHDVVISIGNLVKLYRKMGRLKEAYDFHLKTIKISEKIRDSILPLATQRQKRAYIQKESAYFHFLLNLTAEHFISDSSVINETTNIWLRNKGRLIEGQYLILNGLMNSDKPELSSIAAKLSQTKKELSMLYYTKWSESEAQQYRNRFCEVLRRHDEHNRQLAEESSRYQKVTSTQNTSWRQIASAISFNGVFLDFAAVGDTEYLVFVIQHGHKTGPKLIRLGSAERIDKLIDGIVSEMKKGRQANGNKCREIGQKLYKKLIAPIFDVIIEYDEIIISPDGPLFLLPFEILIDEKGKYFIEKNNLSINYVPSGRLLLQKSSKTNNRKALLIGAPNYDLDYDTNVCCISDTNSNETVGNEVTYSNRAARYLPEGFFFSDLDGAKEEINTISGLLKPIFDTLVIYTGEAAVEELLESSTVYELIHLSTHGFYLPSEKRRQIGSFQIGDHSVGAIPISKIMETEAYLENPLLRSGIVFSGANKSLKELSGDKGILTAEKVLTLPLQGTDLVVLSACQTGIGDITSGEGVFGLQRAFSIAGARNLIMSLWSVPDSETRDLMVRFYQNWLGGMTKRKALAEATRAQLEDARDVTGERYPNPYYWAGFIISGVPEPEDQGGPY